MNGVQMKFMICFQALPEQPAFLPKINALGAGLELQGFGLKGVESAYEWDLRAAAHREVLKQYTGPLAMHGPFVGMDFNHYDTLINDAIVRRMDMTFDLAREFKPRTMVLHTGYKYQDKEKELDSWWLGKTTAFWKKEIERWASAGIRVALENCYERRPDLMMELIETVGHPELGVCLDVGHCNVFSPVPIPEWIERVGGRLFHVHLHDNDGSGDQHLPVGKGKIEFGPVFEALKAVPSEVNLSIEVQKPLEVRIRNLEYVKSLL